MQPLNRIRNTINKEQRRQIEEIKKKILLLDKWDKQLKSSRRNTADREIKQKNSLFSRLWLTVIRDAENSLSAFVVLALHCDGTRVFSRLVFHFVAPANYLRKVCGRNSAVLAFPDISLTLKFWCVESVSFSRFQFLFRQVFFSQTYLYSLMLRRWSLFPDTICFLAYQKWKNNLNSWWDLKNAKESKESTERK